MPLGTLGLAFLAGSLSVLSPCVLPLVPIVLGTAASEHRLGPLALAAGLAISFTTIGLFVATIGFAMGLDTDLFRTISAILLIGVGVLLLVPRLQEQFARGRGAGQPMGRRLSRQFRRHGPRRPIRPRASCSERCGVHASGRRSAPPLC